MSLLVWIPFVKGNCENYGLLGVETSTIGTIIYEDGKLGKAARIGTGSQTSNGILINSNLVDELGDEYSCAVWIKPTGNHVHYEGAIISSGNWNGKKWAFGVNQNNTSVDMFGPSYNRYINCAIPINEWTHLVSIFKNNVGTLYKNGEYVGTYDFGNVVLESDAANTTIGRETYANGYFAFNGDIQDIRIYNHALSPKEVAEIAKGLVLHYKLDENLNVMNNCYLYPTFNTSAAAGGWSHWGGTGHIGTYGQNTDKNYIFNKSNTYSHWVADGAEATANYLVYQSPAFEGGYRSIQCIAKEENGLPITDDIFHPAWNARDGGTAANKWTSVTALGNGFYLCKCEGVHQDGSNDLIGFRVTPGYKVYISEAYCENDKEMSSDIFRTKDLDVVWDCSGYCNNGTSIGTFSSSKLTPRYQYSASFNGTDNIITVPFNDLVPDGIDFTINLWFKKDELGSKNYETLFGGPSGFEMDTRAGSASTLSLYMASTRGGNVFSPFNFGEWYMVTMVNNGTNELYYVNGELKKTIDKKAMPTGTYRIGAWNSNTGQNYKGLMSDFRIYRTALTADQILQLYNTPISLADNGTLFAGEFVET